MRKCVYFAEVNKGNWHKIQNKSDEEFLEGERVF